MHRRVRWENVIRVAGVTLLLAVVVAWPRLAPREPQLPGMEATPLVEPAPVVPQPTVRPDPAPRDRTRSPKRRRSAPKTRRSRTRRAKPERPAPNVRRPEVVVAPAPSGGGTAPVVAPPTPAPDPAQTEFGFEGG